MNNAKEAGAARKKPNILARLLAFLVTLALVLGAVALVAWRDELNLDALKRYLTYRSLSRGDSGQAEEFRFPGDVSNSYALVDGGLLISSVNGIQLYSQSGVEYVNRTVPMEEPIISAEGGTAMVCDVGGTRVYAYTGQEEVFSYETEAGHAILGARVNQAGWLALITEESGYKAAVTVYDDDFRPVIRRSISSAFVMDAVVSPDGRRLAVVTIGQDGAQFESKLTIYPMSDGDAVGQCSLGDEVVLSLRWDSGGIWAVGENSLTRVSADGEIQSVWSYSGRYLKDFALEDGVAVLLLGRYRSGSAGELAVVGSAGTQDASLNLNEEVLSVSAAGHYIAVLTGETLHIYRQDLDEYATLDTGGNARQAIQQDDGSAMVIGADRASLFVPN